MLRVARIFVAALIVGSPVLCAQKRPSLLVISVDGMRPDYVTHADEHGLKIPVLRSFVREGAYAEGVRGVFPTVTYPSHTTLMTGVWPGEHGIVNNQRFDPERKMDNAWYWYADQIQAQTLWSAAHRAGLSTASIGWPVTVNSTDIDTLVPEYWRANVGEPTNADDVYLMQSLARPVGELQRIEGRTHTTYMQGNDTNPSGDEVKTTYALDVLKQHKPQFMTLHLSSLDEEEHLHGPFSAEANADMEQLDGMIGRLVQQEKTNDPNAVIAIVSDHGFADIDHATNLGVAFVQAGLVHLPGPGTGQKITWQAEPWPLGCMFAIMLHDPADTATRDKVRALLTQLAADPANGIEAVFDGSQVAAKGGPKDTPWVVTLRRGFTSGAGVSGPLVTSVPGHRGTHGYDPETTPEMRASFFISGPGIARGKNLGLVDMRQVAPTLATELGVKLSQAKGAVLPVR